MKRIFWLIFIAFASYKSAAANEVWNSKSGIKKFETSQFKNDFYQLANFYQPQANGAYCGVAIAVMILNSLNYGEIVSQKSSEISKPNGEIISYPLYSQESFFNEKVEKIKAKSIISYQQPKSVKTNQGLETKIYDPGLTLSELSKILSKAYKMKVEKHHFKNLNQKEIENFRKKLTAILVDEKNYLVANFDGQLVNMKTRGHFSPIAAYNQESDEVLVMDVALHQNQWFWVSLSNLATAMHSKDGTDYRGYLVISR